MELQINPVFAEVIPELTLDEFAQLEENILAEKRIIDPIITWNGYIVDGHNRYKIAQKHPDIPFSVYEKQFENEEAVIAWICSNQLGRRNINEIQRKCLIATRYEAEKKLEMFNGNRFTLSSESRVGTSCPPYKTHGTRTRLAEELGVTEGYIRNSVKVKKGIDAAEEAAPGMKKLFLNGDIRALDKDIINLAKIPIEERLGAVELMCNPTKKAEEKEAEIDLAHETEKEESVAISNIEDNVLGSMQGCVDTFISTYNNFYVRFPKLREDAHYRKQSLEILKNLKKYIEKVEGELK